MSSSHPSSSDATAGQNADWPAGPVLVVGFARSGQAVAAALREGGVEVRALDDVPSPEARLAAERLGIELLGPLDPAAVAALVKAHRLVVISPGIPPSHPAWAAAEGRAISEVELAWRRSDAPILAITGSNGKTTVTTLVAAMAAEDGLAAAAAGNIGTPLIEAVGRPGLELIVAEVSSFQLASTVGFRPQVAAFLNFAPDHLDWHADAGDYLAAKMRIFANQLARDVAVVNAEDPPVLAAGRAGRARLVTFGAAEGDYHLAGDELVAPDGETLLCTGDLARAFPHDLVNALAATAVAEAAGIGRDACRRALRSAQPLPHRVQLVGVHSGISYYDDSKATTPASVCAALTGVGSCVLIAGGRNKGLDLGDIARFVDERRAQSAPTEMLRAVVAIGEATGEVTAAFAGRCHVEQASSMDEAVAAATALARDGDAVLLSPGCASFDWYHSYAERGEDFARAVAALWRHVEVAR